MSATGIAGIRAGVADMRKQADALYLRIIGIAVLGCALGGCAGGANYVQSAPGHPVHQQALADEVYLDGTGPSARQRPVAQYRPASSATRPSPQVAASRAEDISASTTGTRASTRGGDGQKPFSDEWWEKERREDARLKSKMSICRGC